MCVLDGNAYEQKVAEAGEERDEDLEACGLLLNNKAQALLQAGPGAAARAWRSRRGCPPRCCWAPLMPLLFGSCCVPAASCHSASGRSACLQVLLCHCPHLLVG